MNNLYIKKLCKRLNSIVIFVIIFSCKIYSSHHTKKLCISPISNHEQIDSELYNLKKYFSNKHILMYIPTYHKTHGVSTYCDSLIHLLTENIPSLELTIITTDLEPSFKRKLPKFSDNVKIITLKSIEPYTQEASDELSLNLQELRKKHLYDLIINHCPFHEKGFTINEFSSKNDIPLINTYHGGPWDWLESIPEKYNKERNFFCPKVIQIMKEHGSPYTVSETTANEFKDFYDLSEIKYLYPVANLDFYNPDDVDENEINALKTDYNIHDKKLILMAGRLIEEKGFDIILDSLKLMNHSIKNEIALAIIGFNEETLKKSSDEYCDKLLKIIENYRKQDMQIILVDKVDIYDMRNWYFISDIVVQPSQVNRYHSYEETFGLVNLEARKMGKTVIVSDSGALKENIVNGFNGFIVPKGNSQEIIQQYADYIEKLLNEDNLRKNVGKMAKLIADIQFSQDKNLFVHLKTYYNNIVVKDKNYYLVREIDFRKFSNGILFSST